MIQLAYVSSTSELLRPNEIGEILTTSRQKNAQAGITGLLVYREGSVLQFLEGEANVVRKLYSRISKDGRHHGVILLYEKHIQERDFPEWTMGFTELEGGSLKGLEGYDAVLERGFDLTRLTSSSAQKLIQVFKSDGR